MEEGWCGGSTGVRRGEGSISALLMKACSLLSGGVAMTSEKQQEQHAESCRAETGWLHPQVRAGLASCADIYTLTLILV